MKCSAWIIATHLMLAAAQAAASQPQATRAGTAANDFAPRAAATAPAAPRHTPCTQCRRATGASDLAMFWLMFGGTAKQAPSPAPQREPASGE